jgi:branched-subunit amino acid transport protein
MNEFLLIFGMFLVTFGVRYPVLALVSRIQMPEIVEQGLKYVPSAVLTAIIVPSVLMPGGSLDASLTNVPLLASLVAVLISWRTKNLLLTIIIGMSTLWLLGWLLTLI